jgi:SPP1 gp7 family putative phage head morphogenesis protein
MMNALFHQEGALLDINILASDEAQSFIDAHAAVLDSAFEHTTMSEAMRRRLQRSDYIFSGMKTFHELNEAFPSLLDENGDRKSFERFLNDVQSIDKTYNRNYLRAEFNFVQSSAVMASKWESFMEDGDRYNLQYRTAGDGKVRPEHAALHGVTLPPSDQFWTEFYPPNGWNCRCTVIQVRKSKFPTTDHQEAMERGNEALQKDTKGIFHFNPGIEQKTVPDYNPYTIRRCRDCDIAKGKQSLAKSFIPDNELCDACRVVRNFTQNHDTNQKYYEQLKNNPDYHSVEYDPESGGVKAIHNGHITHSSAKEPTFFGNEKLTSTDLELLCQDALFKKGYRCILLNESKFDTSGKQLPQLDTETNGILMDIRAITDKGKSTIKNALNTKKKQLKNFNAKTGADAHAVILYFHDASFFDESQIMSRLGTTLQEVVCVFRNGEIKKYKKDRPL